MTKTVEVEGVAIVRGISRNKIDYRAEELSKFAPSLVGRPIIKDHQGLTDNVIGKVTEGYTTDNGETVRYKGWIKEDGTGITDKILDKRISEVSIGATVGRLVKKTKDSDTVIARDMTALELSTTPVPGVIGTSIGKSITDESISDEELDKAIESYTTELNKKIESGLQESHSKINKIENINQKEVKMESNEIKTTENVHKVDESVELKARLAEAQKVIVEMKETQRQDAIASYKAKAAAKNIAVKETANMSMETVKALTEMVDSIVLAPAKVEEKKEIATPKTNEVKESVKSNVDFGGYVCEHSSLGGMAFYKSY